ncbi:alanine racemase [Salinirubellus salinus]|uniref:Alanine racemase n=1 Tax=Salinirubellus salinus TaxID=1364945 RepID=A0A9E7U799_9EURY|nr:alanine racemase [Salinirubellus salinus]UWM53371.1 alanine racemase [Salinirubellus salinus]
MPTERRGHASSVPAPVVRLDPSAIRENATAVRDRFDGRVVGVTKAVCGDPVVARAMLAGGLDGLADSRVRNLERLRDAVGPHVERTLLVSPTVGDVGRVLRAADRSLVTERAVVEALSAAARRRGLTHDVVVMVDTGDRREGVLPADAPALVAAAADLDGVRVAGVGTNVGCLSGVLPTAESMASFVETVEACEAAVGRRLDVVSGGSSVTLPLAEAGDLPARVNELRVGEAILLGTDAARDRHLPSLRRDAFTLHAEVVECKRKPATPAGPQGQPVDGTRPDPESRAEGPRRRAVLTLGRQDTVPEQLDPVRDGVRVVGASSDHTVCDVTDAGDVAVGDRLAFRLGYRALLQASTSAYVTRVVGETE